MDTRNNAENTRGRPFQRGNPGRPPGSLNKATVACQTLLDGEAEALTRKVIDLALAGNMPALRLCLERLCPPRRDRPLTVELPIIEAIADLPRLSSAILDAVSQGELELGPATSLASLVANHAKVLELAELEQRIRVLEAKP